MSTLSPTSHVLHRLGCLFIGTPDSMKMPADFYFEKGDRVMPSSLEIYELRVQRSRISTDKFRRDLTWGVGLLSSIGAFAGCVILSVAMLVTQGVVKSYDIARAMIQQADEAALSKQNAVDAQTQTRCLLLAPSQQQTDSACVAVAEKQKAQQKAYWADQCAQMDSDHRARSSMCQEN